MTTALGRSAAALRVAGGGPCDLGADVGADARVAAVWPFFGQFVAHDITADRSPVTHHADAGAIRNFRVPRANLEGLYGVGPAGAPYLYAKDDPAKLLLSPHGDDVPRNHEGIALIGDPRNDVHLFASQLAVAFIISGSEPGSDDASLANRDLQRGQAVRLTSGEAVARRLGVPPLTPGEIGLAERGWTGETPLWLYILKEAEVLHAGEQLGAVGGRVVGEVMVGIIDADLESFRSVDPEWQPTLPGRRPGRFGLADILVPPR